MDGKKRLLAVFCKIFYHDFDFMQYIWLCHMPTKSIYKVGMNSSPRKSTLQDRQGHKWNNQKTSGLI